MEEKKTYSANRVVVRGFVFDSVGDTKVQINDCGTELLEIICPDNENNFRALLGLGRNFWHVENGYSMYTGWTDIDSVIR